MLAHGSLMENKKKELQQQLAEFDEHLAALSAGKGNTGKDDVPRAIRDARLGDIDLAKISVKGKGKERDDTGTEQRTLTDATKTPESQNPKAPTKEEIAMADLKVRVEGPILKPGAERTLTTIIPFLV